MEKDVSKKKTKKVSSDDEEKEKFLILSKADKVKGEQLVITDDGLRTENELKKFALGVDNPEKKYDLYYKGIMKLLRRFLPKGKNSHRARLYVYEEKNTFLTRGKRLNEKGIRGGDSRMAYIIEMEELMNIITGWIVSKGTVYELYKLINDLNISRGVGKDGTNKKNN